MPSIVAANTLTYKPIVERDTSRAQDLVRDKP